MRDVSVWLGQGAGRHAALASVDFEVRPGERLAVIGRSGSGKTTLALCLAGWLRPSSGSIDLSGQVRLLPQDSPGFLHPRWTIQRILSEPDRIATGKADLRQILGLAERAGLAAEHFQKRPWELSSGQRQRVALARALLGAAFRLLVLDEPFVGQDPETRGQLLELLAEEQEKRQFAVVHAVHDLPVLQNMVDGVVTLENGRVVEDQRGPYAFSRLAHPASLRLLEAAAALQGARP
jgi:ABC-type dipeptide/oligopeptide/nickel transport system ATPase subunit